jgi:hypothetical protein
MDGATDECAALQAALDDLNDELAALTGLLEFLRVEHPSSDPMSYLQVIRRRIRDLLAEARWVESRLQECRRAQAADARLDNLKLTQSGMVTRPMPPMPLVAGKTTLLRGTAYIANPRARISAAWLDVVREDTGAVVGSVRGYAIGSDNQSLSDVIRPGEHVHFFIPRELVAVEASYRLEWRLEVGVRTHAGTAFSGLRYQENAGIPMVAISFDEGLWTGPAAPLVFRHHLIHTARIFPVKDTVGPLAPFGAGYGGRDGIRFELEDGLPLPEQGSLGDYENEFVLWDMQVDNEFWAGRFLAFNFMENEDLNRNGTFDADELAKLQAPQGGGNSPAFNRVSNFGGRMVSELQDQRRLVSTIMATEWPEYGMAFVTGTQDLQNRTGLIGNAIGWCTIWPNLGEEDQYPVFAQELAHQWQGRHSTSPLPEEPAYDLLGKRRVPKPKDVMADPMDRPLRDSFLNDSDYDLVHTGIINRIPRPVGGTDTSAPGHRLYVAGTLHNDAGLRLTSVRRYTAAGLRTADKEDLVLRLLDEDGREIGRGAVAFVAPPKVQYRHPVPRATDRQVFAGEIAYDERTRTVVIERQDRELERLKVPAGRPRVVFSGPAPAFDNDWVDLQWDATDPDAASLSYDVSLHYPSTGRTMLLAGNLQQAHLRVRTALLPGGEDVELHIVASNGFNSGRTKVTGLRLPDRPPLVTLLSPASGTTFLPGAFVALSAAAWDPQDGSLADDQLRWTSNQDGDLGRGREPVVRLSSGVHRITVEAIGHHGMRGHAHVELVVRNPALRRQAW